MSDERDPRVDASIAPLPEWQQAVGLRGRELLRAVDPEVTETIARTVQPYFVVQGDIAALQATKDHVNVFLDDPLLRDPKGIISRGHEAKTGRQVMIDEGDEIDDVGLSDLFAQIVAHNRAGGWRKLPQGAG